MNQAQKTILVVEDEHALANALKLRFEKDGFSVVVAHNGKEGLEALDINKVDAIVLDLIMPIMSGFDFLEILKSRKDTPPIIVLSNLGQGEDVQKIKNLGASDYLVKSDVPISEVVRVVNKHLGL